MRVSSIFWGIGMSSQRKRICADAGWWARGIAVLLLGALVLPASPVQAEEPVPAHPGHAEIRPADLPGQPTRSLESREILRAPDGHGQETIVNRTVRAPGTRAPIHFHDAGGLTCVLEGEMTLYLAGADPQKAVAGQRYFMPAGLPMSGVNSGSVNAVLLDIFTVPVGTPVWRVIEDGVSGVQEQFKAAPKP